MGVFWINVSVFSKNFQQCLSGNEAGSSAFSTLYRGLLYTTTKLLSKLSSNTALWKSKESAQNPIQIIEISKLPARVQADFLWSRCSS